MEKIHCTNDCYGFIPKVLSRGTEVVSATGAPIQMPVGEDEINGRLFNVVGEAIDGIRRSYQRQEKHGSPIHREAPKV